MIPSGATGKRDSGIGRNSTWLEVVCEAAADLAYLVRSDDHRPTHSSRGRRPIDPSSSGRGVDKQEVFQSEDTFSISNPDYS
jgi:hypothetical protein